MGRSTKSKERRKKRIEKLAEILGQRKELGLAPATMRCGICSGKRGWHRRSCAYKSDPGK